MNVTHRYFWYLQVAREAASKPHLPRDKLQQEEKPLSQRIESYAIFFPFLTLQKRLLCTISKRKSIPFQGTYWEPSLREKLNLSKYIFYH